MNYILNNEKPNRKEIGNKSFNLKKLEKMGLRVPNYITLTNSYFQEVTPSKLKKLANDLSFILPSKNGWAVRSSSICEDTNNISMAGKYKTLIIDNPENLVTAIYEVLESTNNQEEMAVIIQEFIEADYSGVVFSFNPINNQEDVVIEMAEGRGENIVGGLVNPFTYKEAKWNNSPPNLKEDLVNEIVSTINNVNNNFINEIDMEFCIKNNTIFWLQVRPVTTGFKKYKYKEIENNLPRLGGSWFLLDQCTEPVTPMIQDLDPAGLFKSRQWNTIFVDNYPYIQMRNDIVNKTNDNFTEVKKDWENIKNTFDPLFDNFRSKDFTNYSQKELWSELLKVRQVYKEFTGLYMDRNWMIIRRETSSKIIDFIKLAYGENTNIEHHLSNLSTELGTLTSLKVEALNRILKDVRRNSNQKVEYFLNDSPDFKKFLKDFGYEIPHPVAIHLHTLEEKPELLLERVKKIVDSNYKSTCISPRRWEEYAKNIADRLPEDRKIEFYETLEGYRDCLIRTEDDDYLLQKGAASTRKIVLAIGEFLCKKDFIDDVNDIFFLHATELEDMLLNRVPNKIDINSRKLDFKESQKLSPYPYLMAKSEFEENIGLNNISLKGIGVSSGEAEGEVYIIKNSLDRNEYENIPTNSIVIAPVLTPNLSYNLITASGIITEIGGFLSHGAIFAREIGIPAIVSVKNVMKSLKKGDKVRMNGEKGTIEIKIKEK